ncbi:MAG: hypothetical protein ACJ78Q_19335 [Chloroflexia bacterium]
MEDDSISGQPLRVEQAVSGWRVSLGGDGVTTGASVEPLSVRVAGGETVAGSWSAVEQGDDGLLAHGSAAHPGGVVRFELRASQSATGGGKPGPVELRWRVVFEGGRFEGAVIHSVGLPGAVGDPGSLELPSIHYGRNSYGSGLFPHPDPGTGFAFRADRLAQPGIIYWLPGVEWAYFAGSEAPVAPEPELVYSLGMAPYEGGLRLSFRYPQMEFGHRGDGGRDAYVAKDTFEPGEECFGVWEEGDILEKTLYLRRRPAEGPRDSGVLARFLWPIAYDSARGHQDATLWGQAGEHVRWYNARLYDENVGGGQYVSPEGSGTAMLGFVEQSLLMASTTVTYAAFSRAAGGDMEDQELERLERRAAGALDRWTTEGRTPEGLLYPACDSNGYFSGYRDYSDYENLTIVRDDMVDSIREATEARALLAAARARRQWSVAGGRETLSTEEEQVWVEAALGVANWLKDHALPDGGVASRCRLSGEAADAYPGGSPAAVALFCDCALFLADTRPEESRSYALHAISAYRNTLCGLVREGKFAAGTLDASCPDREAAIAALDACLMLYELTGEEEYLRDGKHAADNVLSYTMTYRITTFGPDTDGVKQGISTFGASIVSPENQHLDPVTTAPGLALYGLYAGDEVCLQAGIESLRWALDGRWAIREEEGLKQSEQLLHTRWYYNTFFSRRGDYRRGMPLWGLTDSEHGWPQVVPTACFLATGQVVLDWPTGRTAVVADWQLEETEREPGKVSIMLTPLHATAEGENAVLLLRLARRPRGGKLSLEVNGRPVPVSSGLLDHVFPLSVAGSGATRIVVSSD